MEYKQQVYRDRKRKKAEFDKGNAGDDRSPAFSNLHLILQRRYGSSSDIQRQSSKAGWPTYDEAQMKDDEIEVPVQINGKTKAVISIAADISKEEAIAAGKEAIADKLTGNVIKEIYVPKKIINIVMK